MSGNVRTGQAVLWRGDTWRICRLALAPTSGVIVSRDGCLPGNRIPDVDWHQRMWDPKGKRWVVPFPREAA